jgi:hypothetical protein
MAKINPLQPRGPLARRHIAVLGGGLGILMGVAAGNWAGSKNICERQVYSSENIQRSFDSHTMNDGRLKGQYYECMSNTRYDLLHPAQANTKDYLSKLTWVLLMSAGGGFAAYWTLSFLGAGHKADRL